MSELDKVINFFDGTSENRHWAPEDEDEYRGQSTPYQWTTDAMLKWTNYWWEIYQVNKKYFWLL